MAWPGRPQGKGAGRVAGWARRDSNPGEVEGVMPAWQCGWMDVRMKNKRLCGWVDGCTYILPVCSYIPDAKMLEFNNPFETMVAGTLLE